MTRESLRAGKITEASITEALMDARGDIFITAAYLECTPREVNSYIKSSETLQTFVAAIGTIKVSPEYQRLSNEQFAEHLEALRAAYQIEAVEVIHELASMKFDSAAMADVKLRAAIALQGPDKKSTQEASQSMVLADLNRLYQDAAPRIQQVRARMVEIEFNT